MEFWEVLSLRSHQLFGLIVHKLEKNIFLSSVVQMILFDTFIGY